MVLTLITLEKISVPSVRSWPIKSAPMFRSWRVGKINMTAVLGKFLEFASIAIPLVMRSDLSSIFVLREISKSLPQRY